MDLPLLYRKGVDYQGKKYVDGGLSDSFPIKKMIELFKPTDILILPNQSAIDVVTESNFGDHLYSKVAAMALPRRLAYKIATEHARRIRSLEWLRYQCPKQTNWLIVWPDNQINRFTQNSAQLRSAVTRSRNFLLNQLKKV